MTQEEGKEGKPFSLPMTRAYQPVAGCGKESPVPNGRVERRLEARP